MTESSDYSTVTELPGGRASRSQLLRLHHRYHLAALQSEGRDVLEVGCGAGLGLGWLARNARRAVGGDCMLPSLRLARGHYAGRVPVLRFDAGTLPFRPRSFDAIVVFETLYYLDRPERFVAECARVLRRPGLLLAGSVNPEWRDFHPSPLACSYFSASQLQDLFTGGGFRAEIFGCFPQAASARGQVLSVLKRTAGRAGLIPKTLRGRENLKRLFFGPLESLPAEIVPNGHEYAALEPLDGRGPHRAYTILYALGHLAAQTG